MAHAPNGLRAAFYLEGSRLADVAVQLEEGKRGTGMIAP